MKKSILISLISLFAAISVIAAVALIIPDSEKVDKTIEPSEEATVPVDDGEVEPEIKNFDIVMHFTGDVLIAENLDANRVGGFNEYANRESADYFLKNAAPYFMSDDFTVVNLENVLSDRALGAASKPNPPSYWFKSKTSNTEILTSSSVECVSVVNNHSRDYGLEGYKDTVAALEKAGLEYGTEDKTVYLEKNGFKIALICCFLWNNGNTGGIIKRIKDAETQSDFQIVFFHGGKEAEHTPEKWKIDACHTLVDNGADAIIGAHPHVLQRAESYNGAKIVYSLGNFCFGGNRSPENRTVIYRLTIAVNPADNSFSQSAEIIPFYVFTGSANNYQPDIIKDSAEAEKVVEYMKGNRNRPY